MADCKPDMESLSWAEPLPGFRHKSKTSGGFRVRILEFDEGFEEPEWCSKTHVGYVLRGRFSLAFPGRAESFSAGDAVVTVGDRDRHKLRVLEGPVSLFVVERDPSSGPEATAEYDDLPFWSAPFGLTLLEKVPLRGIKSVLDVGCGAGCPLVELAGRLGPGVRAVGLDPWEKALERLREKCAAWGVPGVETVVGSAEKMPFSDNEFDLVVSNNGLNNVADADAALAECRRVSRPDARFVMTANLPGTMAEFYGVYRSLLSERFGPEAVRRLDDHIREKRPALEEWSSRLARANYAVEEVVTREFVVRYADGGALLRHWFIRLAFLEPWTKIVPAADVDETFKELSRRLDAYAALHDGLTLTVPYVCIVARASCRRPSAGIGTRRGRCEGL